MIETAESAETTATSASRAEPDAAAGPPARRATKFMAELSRAMQAASENARSETMARFEVEAKSVIEDIHANATNEAADLRRLADDDVATVREWSKAEIARIREETEARIAARKSGLDGEMEQHAATVLSRTERVAAVVAEFQAQMEAFFGRLNAETDPTRIATMAETMPDPPSLGEIAASIAGADAPVSESLAPAADQHTPTEFDFAAAEAEAAAFSADLDSEDDLPVAEGEPLDGAPVGDPAPGLDDRPADELTSTRVVVSGLASVANIANFKRGLVRLPGVATIAVASGPDSDFVFTVGHTLGSALSASVQALSGFDIQVTAESDEAINVAAVDREGAD